MPFNIGPGELILILVIALVVLGPGKLPDVASSLGKSVREFRKAATDVSDAGRLDSTASSTASTAQAAPSSAAPVEPAPAAPPPSGASPDGTAATGPTAASPARDSNAS